MKFKSAVIALLLMGFAKLSGGVEPLPVPLNISFNFCSPVVINLQAAINCPAMIVQNNLPFAVSAQLSAGLFSTVNFTAISVTLNEGEARLISLSDFKFGAGRQVLHVAANVFDPKGMLVPGIQPVGYQALAVDDLGQAQAVEFDDAFLSRRTPFHEPSKNDQGLIDLGAGFVDKSPISAFQFASHALPANVMVIPFNNPDPRDMVKMPLGKLNHHIRVAGGSNCDRDDDERAENRHDEHHERHYQARPPCRPHDVKDDDERDERGERDDDNRGRSRVAVSAKTSSAPAAQNPLASALALAPGDPIIKGNMSMLYPDGTYHAAWGWVVRGWQQVLFFWIPTAWTYVGGDGSWQLNLPLGNSPVFVEYRPANRFVQLQDAGGNVYAWGDSWNLTGPVTDIGYRAADFSNNGDLPNVHKLYVGATDVWIKFYNNGMNALRDSPIEVTFPNNLNSGHCIYNTDSNGMTVPTYAWSCSETANGRIWVIPAHADNFVVQHEIGHSINSYYWNNSMPPGAGGAHSLTQCYNNGLALSEGFANFLAYWTQFDRTQTNPTATYANYNVETINNNACSGPSNETRVSGAFWDMYDYWNDGTDVNSRYDSLLYVNQASAVSIYLGNKKNGMPDYLDVVKAGQSTYWQGEFEKLFRLNTIIP